MQSFAFVDDVALVTLAGEAIQNPDGQPGTISQEVLFLQRCEDPAFTANLDALIAAKLQIETKRRIDSQRATAKARGLWVFEDAQARALQKGILKGAPYNPRVLHCLMPFLESAEKMQRYEEPKQD
jgi:hypothetical protein